MSYKALLDEVRKYYKTCLLLGEVTKSEGAADATLRNALNRFTEMGFIRSEQRGRGGRDQHVLRGAEWDRLEPFVLSLEESLRVHVASRRA
jgi:predicted transcriptional regulator